MKKKPVRVRIAPSPTGDPHVGLAYMTLFNWTFAKQNKGLTFGLNRFHSPCKFDDSSKNHTDEYII